MCDPTDIILSNYLAYLRKSCAIYSKDTTLILINYNKSCYIFYDDTYCHPHNLIQSMPGCDLVCVKSTYTYENNHYGYYVINESDMCKFKCTYKQYNITILSSVGDMKLYYPGSCFYKPDEITIQSYRQTQEIKSVNSQTMLAKITYYGSFEDIETIVLNSSHSSYTDIGSLYEEDKIVITSNYTSPINDTIMTDTGFVYVTLNK